MTFFSSGMLLLKCMTIVLLGLLGKKWVVTFMVADLGLYLFIKVARGDFHYWVGLDNGKLELLSSILARVLVKIVTDFTSIVQFRHPFEVGGMYWAFSFVLTMGSLPVATVIFEYNNGDKKVLALARTLFNWVFPTTLFFLVLFFKNIDKHYIGTFFSLQRGKDMTMKCFRESSEDSAKAHYSFAVSKKHWHTIEEEVRGWVEANWSKWEEEQPKWFDANMKSKVPVEFIPTAGARKAEGLRRVITKMQFDRANSKEARKARMKKQIDPIFEEEAFGTIMRSLSNLKEE
jgi:hypothetical protein